MNILVTGASKGIGFEVVKQFSINPKNNIVALSRDVELLKKLQLFCEKEHNNKIHICSVDFLSNSLDDELQDILSKHDDHFDIIINNAGYLINKPFVEVSSADAQKIFQVNVFAPIQLLKLIIPRLDSLKECHIVNIGSMGGFQGSVKFPGLSMYSASKAALANLTECLAEEYKNSKIIINCLAVGSVQTEMLEEAFPGFHAQLSPVEIGKYIVDFALNGGHYFNGKIIPVTKSTP